MNKLPGFARSLLAAAAVIACLLVAAPVSGQTPEQPSVPNPQGAAEAPVAVDAVREAQPDAAHTGEEEHHSIWAGLFWPTVNFAILFGGLWYFLRTPMRNYLAGRHETIRRELVEASKVRSAAEAQLAEIDRKLAALPGEIEALRRRGAEEIASEEARIAAQAAAERERLLEQTRREIDLQLRLAKRELVEHAADLAVQLASERIRQQITPEDQARLVDRYLESVARPSA